jgi:aspartate beta-hydroxylase/beta-hydroxylase
MGWLLLRGLDRAYLRAVGGDRRPVFFDVERTHPELRAIDANYDAIRMELLAILPSKDSFPRYHEVDPNQVDISAPGRGSWRTFFVRLFGSGNRLPTCKLCPRTTEIVDRVPHLLQAFFSILDPGKSVPAHDGPHHYYLRYHTAFVVPRENPPKIRIKDQVYCWKERESVLFDDSWNHEVYNQSDSVRVVLITDFIRPKPWYLCALTHFALWFFLLGRDERLDEARFQRVLPH